MAICEVIRERRKTLGLTQEQVADYLGISAPAVNKWEKGGSYPDISLLAPLARLLEVDLNTLLCFEAEVSQQEITHFGLELTDVIKKEGIERGFQMGMEMVQKFPNCIKLIHTIALILDGALIMNGLGGSEKKNYNRQIMELYQRIVNSKDEQEKSGAALMLASKYMEEEEYGKAHEMLDLVPESNRMDKRQVLANLLIKEGKIREAAGILEQKLLWNVIEVENLLLSLIDVEIQEGSFQNAEQLADISEDVAKVFELWEYWRYVGRLQAAFGRKDAKTSIDCLNAMFEAAKNEWNLSETFLFRHMHGKGNSVESQTQVQQALLALAENDPKAEFLRSSPEFQKMIRKLRKKTEG